MSLAGIDAASDQESLPVSRCRRRGGDQEEILDFSERSCGLARPSSDDPKDSARAGVAMTSAVTLAETAQRCALVEVVRRSHALPLSELLQLTREGQHADVLASISIGELVAAPELVEPRLPHTEPLEVAVLRLFELQPERRFASSMICKRLGLRRWTAQRILRELVGRGAIERAGKTSSTRYWLAHG